MDRQPSIRQRRALLVSAAAIVLGLAGGVLTDPMSGFGIALVALGALTLITIPRLEPGEYDLFGIAVIAVLIAVGVIGLATERRPHVVYTKYDDPG